MSQDNEKFKEKVDAFPYLLILPAMVVLLFVFTYPILKAISLSFHSARFTEKAPFCGFDNYKRMLLDPFFWYSLRLTTIYTISYIIGVFTVGGITALLVNCKIKGRKLARAIITFPFAVPSVVACLVWMWMFDYTFGVLNYLLKEMHLISKSVGWLIDPSVALFSVMLVTIWRFFPLHTLIIFAGLQSIPEELYEGARVDGANSIQRFFYITIPGIKRVLSILLLLTTVWSFRRFAILFILTHGGPSRATEVLAVKIYRNAFRYYDMGYAAAMAIFMLLLLILFTSGYLALTRKEA